MRFLSGIILALLCMVSTLSAQNPVDWKWSVKATGDNELELQFKAKIQDGWYTYSQFLESDDGPLATVITFDSKNQDLIGKATEVPGKPAYKISGHDEMFDMNIIKYKKSLTITQKFTIKDKSKPVVGYLEYMCCDATRCMPPKGVDFEIDPAKYLAAATTPKKEAAVEGIVATETPQEAATPETTEETTEAAAPDVVKPVTWEVKFNKISETEVELVANASIIDGWNVYSQKLESDDGPVATEIVLEEELEEGQASNVTIVSNEESTSAPSNKKSGVDPVFDMELTKYTHDFTIKQRMKVADASKAIKGYLTYMTCDATKCMPPTDVEFNFSFNGSVASTVTVDGNKYNPSRGALISSRATAGSCDETVGADVDNDDNIANLGLFTIFILGFGGGLLALLTPCVFPMIPLTVSFFTKRSKSKAAGIRNALTYGASIIVIYVSLGMLITVSVGPDALNLLSTHWLMNFTFFVLFSVFAFSFFGYYEISLPSSWTNKADNAADKGGLLGIFFMAFSLSLVSFSCTGPIVGTLLVQAAVNGGVVGPMMGMFGFSAALALPFALFAAFPGWLNSLPRSGGWMTSVKVVLGFLELALGLKFLSTADLTMHWGILPYELFIGLWVILFGLMAAYLFGFIHFPHDNPKAKISNKRKGLATVVFVFTVYVASGFMIDNDTKAFSTPSVLSGLAPSACYSYVNPCHIDLGDEQKALGFSDHCPPGINQCFDDYDKGMAYAKKVNKPVLLDFTGFGCVNCRKMEENVWVKEDINKLLNEDYILISLYVDDRKKLDQVLEGPNGDKIRNVGNKWAAFQEVNFGTQSQPYYVLVSPDEQVLNKPTAYTPNVEEYKDFLNCGLKTFSNLKK